MSQNHNSVVALFSSHDDAESAVKELEKSGFDMKKLSVIGKDYESKENVIGYYNTGDRVQLGENSVCFGERCGACCLARHFCLSPAWVRLWSAAR